MADEKGIDVDIFQTFFPDHAERLAQARVRQEKWDFRFLNLARFIADWSKDPSTKVGAVIVKEINKIVSLGYNGFPRGMEDSYAHLTNREEKYSRVVHAEINALLFAEQSVRGCTLYTFSFLPCERCAVQVIQAGIIRVVAPVPSPEIVSRWGAALEKSRGYFKESNVQVTELNFT